MSKNYISMGLAKVLAIIVSFMVIFSFLPAEALAYSDTQDNSGTDLEHSTYELSTGKTPTDLRVGDTAKVDVTLAAKDVKDLGYDNVRVNAAVAGPGAAHLLAKDTSGKQYDVAAVGYWGPADGFAIAKDYSVTTAFTCGFEAAGEYTITLSLVDMADGQRVLASDTATVTVTVKPPVAGTTPTVCNALGNNFVTIAYDSPSKSMDINIHKDRLTDAVKNTALAQKSGAGSYKGLAYEGVKFSAPEGATKVSVDGDDAEALVGGAYTQWYPVLYAVNPGTTTPIFPFVDANIIQSQDKTLAEQLGTTPYQLITRIEAGRSLTGSMDLEWLDDSGNLILAETIDFNYKQTPTPAQEAQDAALHVKNEAELRAALASSYVTQIQLEASFSLGSTVDLNKAVSIDGQNFTVTGPGAGHGFNILANNVAISNLTVTGSAKTDLNFYEVTGGTLSNVTLSNAGNAGMIVNGSEVTISGVTTKNNKWGGINVDQGSGVTNIPHLTVTDVMHHTSPAGSLTPAIWVDKGSNTGWVSAYGSGMYTEADSGAAHIYYDKTEYAAAEALGNAKTAALNELNGYKSTSSDYSSANWALIDTKRTAGAAAINAAGTPEEVNTALAAAKAEIDTVKTLAQEAQEAALDVKNEAELRAALASPYVTQIQLTASFSLGSTVDIGRAVSIDGQNHTVTGPSPGHGFNVLANNVAISNLTVTGSAKTNVNFYAVTGGTLTNVTLANAGNAGMIVNGSEVTISGVTTTNNKWGGINVDQGSGVVAIPHLTVTDVTHHTSPAGKLTPAIWVDKGSNTGWVSAYGSGMYTEIDSGAAHIYYDKTEYAAAEAAEALANAKTAALNELNGYKTTSSDYSSANWASIVEKREAGVTAINAAGTPEEVNIALAAAKAEIDAVKTLAQEAQEAALDVKNEAELRAALASPYVTQIQLTASFSLGSTVDIGRAVSIDGQNHTVTGPSAGHGFNVLANNVAISNLTVTGSAKTNVNFYAVTGGTLTNVTLANAGNAGMIVNGSEVTISGVTTTNNKWGGINVDQGSGVVAIPHLTVTDVTHHTSPAGKLTPAIWVDKGSNTGWVSAYGSGWYTEVNSGATHIYYEKAEYAAYLPTTIPNGSSTAFGSETYSVTAGDKLTMSATTQFPNMSGADPSIYEDGQITLDKAFDHDVTLSLKYDGTLIGTYTLAAGDTSFWVSQFSGMTPRQPLNVQTSGIANTITIEAVIPANEAAKTVTVGIKAVAAALGDFDTETKWIKVLAEDSASLTVNVPSLTAQDFGVWNTDAGTLGKVKGYSAGFGLTNADFTGATVVVKLYAGDILLQTNTAVAGQFDSLTQLSSPFDVYGNFNYVADGYWSNVKAQGADQTLLPTRVEATVTLPSGIVLTATNANLTGDPASIVPVFSAQDFGVCSADEGTLGKVKGYSAGFSLTGADFTDATVVVKLYAGDTLLQTSTAVAGKFDSLTQLSGPFDVYGNFNYVADGYWTNVKAAGADQTLLPTKVVATVTLANGKVLTAENTNLTGDPASIVPVLSAQDFGVWSTDAGTLGKVKGYSAGFSLTGADFTGATVVMKLYAGDTLLQTDTAVAGKFDYLTQLSGPFDVYGNFNYIADGYWTNVKAAGADQTLLPTKVVATVTLANGKVLTAENTNLTGDPSGIVPVLTGIAITTDPTKTVYVVGETFDPAGLVLTATYNNSSTKEVTKDDSGFGFTPDRPLTLADTTVTVSFGGQTAQQDITVLDKGALVITVVDSNGNIFPGIGLTVYSDAALNNPVGSGVSDAAAGIVTVSGLDAGTYYILVTSVPAGYHLPDPNVAIDYDVAYGAPTSATFILPKSAVYGYSSTQLSDIKVSAGALAPAFDPETYKYNLKLDENTGSVTITPKLSDSASKLYIDGRRVTAKKVTLTTGGKDTIKIQVKPKTGKSVYYYVYVSRDKSSNANLASLRKSRGTMTPTFAPDTTNYTVELANNQSSVTFTLKPANKYATYTMTLNGKRTHNRTVALKLDETKTLVITVKAQDGSTKPYTITIHRNVSHNADLKGLKTSRGTLAPTFDAAQPKYSLELTSAQSSVTLTIKLADSTAKYSIMVGGKSSGRTISVAKGTTKEVSIVVTSQAGDVKTYIVDITRAS